MDLSLVTLGKWQPFPEPQFSPLKMGRGLQSLYSRSSDAPLPAPHLLPDLDPTLLLKMLVVWE